MSVQVCPVCNGKGLVPNGFYDVGSNTYTTTSATPETCKSCGGKDISLSIHILINILYIMPVKVVLFVIEMTECAT